MLGENLDEECLTEKVCVFFAGLVIDTEDSGHVVVVNFLTGVVDQMIGNLSEGIDITDFEAAFDVFLQDGADEALDIPTLVPNTLKFGETSCSDVVHEGALAGCLCLCRNAGSVYLMECAILSE